MRTISLVGFTAWVAIAGWSQAQAAVPSPVTLVNSGSSVSFDFDGLTFTVSGCSDMLETVASSCGAANVEMEAVSSASGTEIEFLGNGNGSNGTNLFSNVFGNNDVSTLSFTLTVAGGANQLNAESTAITGSATSTAAQSDVYAQLKAATVPAVTTTLASGATAMAFTPVNNLSLNVSLGLLAASPTDHLTLTNAALTFKTVPEPMSVGLLATGVTGLMLVRRRRHARPQPPKTIA